VVEDSQDLRGIGDDGKDPHLRAGGAEVEDLAAEGAGVLVLCCTLRLIRRISNEVERTRRPLSFAYKGNIKGTSNGRSVR
jgi:hypothetical protein